ncbi:MAG: hypothetical protein WA063_02680 [Minisyncoccia bacterium]
MKETANSKKIKYIITATLFFVIIFVFAFAYQNRSFVFEKKGGSPVVKEVIAEGSVTDKKKESNSPSLNVVAIEDANSDGDKEKINGQENDISVIAKWLSDIIGIEKREARTLNVPEGYKTIQSAINSARKGDTIKVAEGEFKENIIVKNGIVLEGSGADKTILNGDNLGNVVAFKGAYDIKTSLSGFTIRNSGKSLSGMLIEDSSPWIHDNIITENEYGIYIKGESAPAIQKNVINFSNKGIQVYNFKAQAEEKESQEADQIAAAGIAINAENIKIGGNTETKPNIIDNLITDNKIGVDLYNSTAKIEHNNISYNNHYRTYLGATFGINLAGSSAEITNNIISDSGICELCGGISADIESKNVVISYNDIWNNKNDYVCFGECILEDNNVSEDPLYMDTISGDYKLKEESTLIGKAKDGLDIGVRW